MPSRNDRYTHIFYIVYTGILLNNFNTTPYITINLKEVFQIKDLELFYTHILLNTLMKQYCRNQTWINIVTTRSIASNRVVIESHLSSYSIYSSVDLELHLASNQTVTKCQLSSGKC